MRPTHDGVQGAATTAGKGYIDRHESNHDAQAKWVYLTDAEQTRLLEALRIVL